MKKALTTLEVLNIGAWYKQARESEKKPLNSLPLKVQWILKKNMTVLNPIIENFTNLQKEAEDELRNNYISDEKSFADKDADGNDIRKIKDEYMSEFQDEVADMNSKLNDILMEVTEIEFSPIDVDKILDEIGDKETPLTVEDLEILELMKEE